MLSSNQVTIYENHIWIQRKRVNEANNNLSSDMLFKRTLSISKMKLTNTIINGVYALWTTKCNGVLDI